MIRRAVFPVQFTKQTKAVWGNSLLGKLLLLTILAGPVHTIACSAHAENAMQLSNKLGPELKMALQQESVESAGENLVALAQVSNGGLTDERRAQLKTIGVSLRGEAGDVATMTLPVSSIESLVAFDWVLYVEASRPLMPEANAPPPSAFE